jgi:hypothetical protein
LRDPRLDLKLDPRLVRARLQPLSPTRLRGRKRRKSANRSGTGFAMIPIACPDLQQGPDVPELG